LTLHPRLTPTLEDLRGQTTLHVPLEILCGFHLEDDPNSAARTRARLVDSWYFYKRKETAPDESYAAVALSRISKESDVRCTDGAYSKLR
jgi:hypothetical protein